MSAFTSEGRHAAGRIERGGVARMVVIGVVGWALAALFIRYANWAGLFRGVAEVMLFALCVPIAWGTARALRWRGRLQADQILPAMAVGVIAALFLDGVALTAAPWIYGAARSALLPAAAWLLFGVGAFLTAAFLESRRDTADA